MLYVQTYMHSSVARNGVDLASTLQHYNKDDEVLDMADEHDRSLSHIRQEGVENKVRKPLI